VRAGQGIAGVPVPAPKPAMLPFLPPPGREPSKIAGATARRTGSQQERVPELVPGLASSAYCVPGIIAQCQNPTSTLASRNFIPAPISPKLKGGTALKHAHLANVHDFS
jgi:hypothetical protein